MNKDEEKIGKPKTDRRVKNRTQTTSKRIFLAKSQNRHDYITYSYLGCKRVGRALSAFSLVFGGGESNRGWFLAETNTTQLTETCGGS